MTLPARLRKADIDRAIKAARDGGLTVARVIIDPDEGRIILETEHAAPPDDIDLVEYGR